jgi:aldehyde:ferredoxin oxidoreductase
MDRLGGYAGRILEIDLTSRRICESPLPLNIAARFIGGPGINAWLAYRNIERGTLAFSAKNVLIFGAGPLVGTLAPAAGKTNFTSKSPLSHFIGSSNSGHMGMLKFAGYDHLVIKGKAASPVYLEVGDEVRIRDAAPLWGKDTWDVTDIIWRELGRQYAVAAIGPAGENLVRDASIVANKYSLFAKTGMGAVMGAKNLKAIAAYGTRGVSIAEPKVFARLVNEMRQQIVTAPGFQLFRHRGTLVELENMIEGKTLSMPYKNCQQAADKQTMSGFEFDLLEHMTDHGKISCLACPVGCKHSFRLKEGPWAGLTLGVSCAGAPACVFGGNTAVGSWSEALKCQELVNRLGMDNATAGLVAWAIELYQRGVIDKKDTGGLELDWKPEIVQDLLRKIAYREGLGDILADGFLEAPRRIGRGSDYYALHYKGVPNSTGDPRPILNSWIVSLITNVFGHAPGVPLLYGRPKEKVERALRRIGIPQSNLEHVLDGLDQDNIGWLTRCTEDFVFALNCLGVCVFDFNQRLGVNLWAEMYSAATGIQIDGGGLLEAGARGVDLRKALNLREGASREDDTVPKRFLSESVQCGSRTMPPFDSRYLDKLVTDYYAARGWDPLEGTVSEERLGELVSEG